MYCCDNYEYSLHCPENQKRLTLREMTFVRGLEAEERRIIELEEPILHRHKE